MLRVSTGGMAFGPRGTAHAFQNIGETPGAVAGDRNAIWA